MASVEKLSEKLSKILQKNIDEKQGCAIALAGEWGIGKTHFWNYFYENNHKDFNGLHYAYVSLFGVDSLESLKWEIAVKSFSITNKEDKFSGLKGIFAKAFEVVDFSKLNNDSNGFGLALTSNLVKNSISHFISHTVICIDDLERKSDKLDLKDVMGLVNQLKLEKNCQVIMILHEDKADKQYQEYKEKVFDDVFYLTENFEIIKGIIENDEVIRIYQEFYDKLQVKNIRFYERVNKDYNEIVSLIDDLTITSKEHILRNLLMVRYAEFSPKKFENENYNFTFDLNFILDFNIGNLSDSEFVEKIDRLDKFFNGFISFYSMDNWIKIIAKSIINHYLDEDVLKELVNRDRVSEQSSEIAREYMNMLREFHNIDLRPDFLNRLYRVSLNMIGKKDYNTLSFCYQIIKSGNEELANDFKLSVEKYIENFIQNQNAKLTLNDFYDFNIEKYDIFADFVKKEIDKYKPDFDFCKYFFNYYHNIPYIEPENNVMENITKDELKQVIWLENENLGSRRNFIKSILGNRYFSNEKREQIRQWVIELLNEKIQENPDSELAVKFWLNHTENLTKF